MATSALTISGALKQAWTDEELQKQFEDRNSPLSALETVRGTMIGSQAQVAILPGRAGSYTSVGAAGGALNPATGQPVTQAVYTMNASSGVIGPWGGFTFAFAAAGTYTVSVQFKASSGSVTASNRKLWVWTIGF